MYVYIIYIYMYKKCVKRRKDALILARYKTKQVIDTNTYKYTKHLAYK